MFYRDREDQNTEATNADDILATSITKLLKDPHSNGGPSF